MQWRACKPPFGVWLAGLPVGEHFGCVARIGQFTRSRPTQGSDAAGSGWMDISANPMKNRAKARFLASWMLRHYLMVAEDAVELSIYLHDAEAEFFDYLRAVTRRVTRLFLMG